MLKFYEKAPFKSYPFPFCEEDSFLFIFYKRTSAAHTCRHVVSSAPNAPCCALASDIFTLTKGRMILRTHSPISRARLGFGFFGDVHTRCSRLAYKSSSNHEREARAVDCLFTFLCFLWQKRARDLTGANDRNRK